MDNQNLIVWANSNLFDQTAISGNSIVLSVAYFFFCLMSINGIGKFLNQIFFKEKDYHPFFGIGFIMSYGGLAVMYKIFFSLLYFLFLPLGFFYYSFLILKKKIIFENSYLFYLVVVFCFFIGFFQFHYNYDDHAGYFYVIEQFKTNNYFENAFNFRLFQTYPSFYFLNSIFLQYASFFQAKFIDIFYSYYLFMFLIFQYLKNISFNNYEKYFLIVFTFFLTFSLNTTISVHMIAGPFILLSLILFFEMSKRETHTFKEVYLFYICCSVLVLFSSKFISLAFFLGFFFTLMILTKKFSFKKILLANLLSLLIFFPWSNFYYSNFNTLLYPIFGHGTSLESYTQYSDYLEQTSKFAFNISGAYDLFTSHIPHVLGHGYRLDLNHWIEIFIYKFTYHHILFFLILIFYISYITKTYSLLILGLITLLVYVSYFFTGTSIWTYSKFLYPIVIAFSVFSLLYYIRFFDFRKKIPLLIVLSLSFLIFEKLSLLSYARNFTQEILKINTRGGEANKFNVLYKKGEINFFNNLTKNIKNKNILTYVDRSYLINHKKNNIFPIDFHSFLTSPAPGFPNMGSMQEYLDYFRDSKIDYILTHKDFIKPNWRNAHFERSQTVHPFEHGSTIAKSMNLDFSLFIKNIIESKKELVMYYQKTPDNEVNRLNILSYNYRKDVRNYIFIKLK
mgnify:CR=1 FL=1